VKDKQGRLGGNNVNQKTEWRKKEKMRRMAEVPRNIGRVGGVGGKRG